MISFAFGDTIAQIDFDANTAFFTYPYAYGGGSATGGSAAGGNPGTGDGGGISNQYLTFAELQNGITTDPNTNPKSWANVTEIQVGFNVNNGQTALWGADNNNVVSFDNFVLTQVNPVPEPVSGILSALLLGTVGLIRRRR